MYIFFILKYSFDFIFTVYVKSHSKVPVGQDEFEINVCIFNENPEVSSKMVSPKTEHCIATHPVCKTM